jgi:hypothetical protein
MAKLRVVLDVAPKKAFATAIDWPGWSRGAKTPDEALAALIAYGPRYAKVAKRAKVSFEPPKADAVEVVEELEGGASTEFGIPASNAAADDERVPPAELKRLVSLLDASWKAFDRAAKEAHDVALRLGPRGGGRQVPKMIAHLHEADEGYLHALGTKGPGGSASIDELRRAFVDAVTARAAGRPLENPNKVRRPWSARYAIRRSAWHALDHAWEIEDRSR